MAEGDPEVSALLAMLPDRAVNIVTEGVLGRISTEKAPQGVICTVRHLDKLHKNNTIYNNTSGQADDTAAPLPLRAIILDGVGDPGNLGTIIRTAAAFGVGELILGPGCADIYNPRTVRASMGALFRQRTTRVERLAESVTALRRLGAEVYAATLEAKLLIGQLFPRGGMIPVYVVIGNEGHGISDDVIAAATSTVTIPISGNAESLNAAVAAAIFMWAGRVL